MSVPITPEVSKPIPLPLWMSERRQVALFRFMRFAWDRGSGKLFLTSDSLPRLCRDADLMPHEVHRAIDDLFFLRAVDVRSDGLTDVVTLRARPDAIAWRFARVVGADDR